MDLQDLENLTGVQNIKIPTHKILFDKNCERNEGNYILLEVNENILKSLEQNKKFKILGQNDDNAVLCTETEEYAIKMNETSNSLLLINSNLQPDVTHDQNDENISINSHILGTFSVHYELHPTKPSAQNLIKRLNEYPYMGPEKEKQYDADVFLGLQELQEICQCSDCSLITCLSSLNAIFIDSYWRLLDEMYFYKCVIQILNIVDAKLWDFCKISILDACATLAELFPNFVVEHCLKLCSSVLDLEDTNYVELNVSKVCKITANYILFKVGSMMLKDFYETWQQLMPIGMKVSSEYLKGIALEDRDLNIIKYLPLKNLSFNIGKRLDQLFDAQEKWDKDYLEIYLEDLLDSKTSIDVVLMKYCQKVTSSDQDVRYVKKLVTLT